MGFKAQGLGFKVVFSGRSMNMISNFWYIEPYWPAEITISSRGPDNLGLRN